MRLPFPSPTADPRTDPPVVRAAYYWWAALCLLTLAIYGNLLPLNFQPRPLGQAVAAVCQLTLIDLWDVNARGDWVLSTALFAALGFTLMAARCVNRDRRADLRAALIVLPFGLLLSVFIEFLQVFFPPRTVSLNDVVVEGTGMLLGILAWVGGGRRFTEWVRRLGSATTLADLASHLLPAYLALTVLIQLVPFDLVLSPRELGLKAAEGRLYLVPLVSLTKERGLAGMLIKVLATLAVYFPVGFLRSWPRRSATGARRCCWRWCSRPWSKLASCSSSRATSTPRTS